MDSQPVVLGHRGHHTVVFSAVLLILLGALVGVYTWQHTQVGHLQSQVERLTEQVDSLQAQLGAGSATAAPGNPIVTGGIQEETRDTKRHADINMIQTQLEAFFSQFGYYPSLADINNAAWRAANMKSLDPTGLVDPLHTGPTVALAAVPTPAAYAYTVTNNDGASCEHDDKTCAQYTLTATFEGTVNGSNTFIKKNLD